MVRTADDVQEEIDKLQPKLDAARAEGNSQLATELHQEVLALRKERIVLLEQGAGGSGSHIAGGGQAATVSQLEYLQERLVDKVFDTKPVSSTISTNAPSDRRYKITEWNLTAVDLSAVQSSVAEALEGLTIARRSVQPDRPGELPCNSEAASNIAFFNDLCGRLNEMYKANSRNLRWELNPQTEVSNLKPDFVLKQFGPGCGPLGFRDFMYAEGKFHSVLGRWQLVAACNEVWDAPEGQRMPPGLNKALCRAVNQECGYMLNNCQRYGFLTSLRHTFFIRYVAPWHYEITAAFLNSVAGPSVGEMLYCITERALAEGKVTDPAGMPGSTSPFASKPDSVDDAEPGSGAGNPAKSQKRADRGAGPGSTVAGTSRSLHLSHSGIPEGALVFGNELGRGLCGATYLGSLSGQTVVIKSVDAHNSAYLIPHILQEADILSGPLDSLQDVCVPKVLACGYAMGGSVFVLVKSYIEGRRPKAGREIGPVSKAAEQVLQRIHRLGVAHGDICRSNVLIDADGKVHFIDFGHSSLDPTPAKCEQELQELRALFSDAGSPDSVLEMTS